MRSKKILPYNQIKKRRDELVKQAKIDKISITSVEPHLETPWSVGYTIIVLEKSFEDGAPEFDEETMRKIAKFNLEEENRQTLKKIERGKKTLEHLNCQIEKRRARLEKIRADINNSDSGEIDDGEDY